MIHPTVIITIITLVFPLLVANSAIESFSIFSKRLAQNTVYFFHVGN